MPPPTPPQSLLFPTQRAPNPSQSSFTPTQKQQSHGASPSLSMTPTTASIKNRKVVGLKAQAPRPSLNPRPASHSHSADRAKPRDGSLASLAVTYAGSTYTAGRQIPSFAPSTLAVPVQPRSPITPPAESEGEPKDVDAGVDPSGQVGEEGAVEEPVKGSVRGLKRGIDEVDEDDGFEIDDEGDSAMDPSTAYTAKKPKTGTVNIDPLPLPSIAFISLPRLLPPAQGWVFADQIVALRPADFPLHQPLWIIKGRNTTPSRSCMIGVGSSGAFIQTSPTSAQLFGPRAIARVRQHHGLSNSEYDLRCILTEDPSGLWDGRLRGCLLRRDAVVEDCGTEDEARGLLALLYLAQLWCDGAIGSVEGLSEEEMKNTRFKNPTPSKKAAAKDVNIRWPRMLAQAATISPSRHYLYAAETSRMGTVDSTAIISKCRFPVAEFLMEPITTHGFEAGPVGEMRVRWIGEVRLTAETIRALAASMRKMYGKRYREGAFYLGRLGQKNKVTPFLPPSGKQPTWVDLGKRIVQGIFERISAVEAAGGFGGVIPAAKLQTAFTTYAKDDTREKEMATMNGLKQLVGDEVAKIMPAMTLIPHALRTGRHDDCLRLLSDLQANIIMRDCLDSAGLLSLLHRDTQSDPYDATIRIGKHNGGNGFEGLLHELMIGVGGDMVSAIKILRSQFGWIFPPAPAVGEIDFAQDVIHHLTQGPLPSWNTTSHMTAVFAGYSMSNRNYQKFAWGEIPGTAPLMPTLASFGDRMLRCVFTTFLVNYSGPHAWIGSSAEEVTKSVEYWWRSEKWAAFLGATGRYLWDNGSTPFSAEKWYNHFCRLVFVAVLDARGNWKSVTERVVFEWMAYENIIGAAAARSAMGALSWK